MAMSLDGFTAGLNQSFEKPFGDNFDLDLLERWMFAEPEKHKHKKEIDAILDAGAFIMGNNMFGPKDRRDNPEWKGWWGDNPPYHAPVFVLSHKEREPIEMEGGTTFYFVTGGIHEALDRARDAANGMDVRIGGGPETIQQYLRAGLIDELHVAISPVLLGGGERLFEGIDVRALGYECVQFVASEKATHVVLRRQGQ